MKDTNFFEPYIDKKEFNFKAGNLAIIITLSVIIITMVLFPITNKIRTYQMNKEITNIDREINSETNKSQKINIENKRQEILELKEKDRLLQLIKNDFYEKDNVGEFLVYSITDSMVGEMFLKDLEITGDEITITGISKQKTDIAVFEKNLRKVVYFDQVFMPNMTLNEDYYEYSVDIKINNKEVNIKKQQQNLEAEELESEGEDIEAE